MNKILFILIINCKLLIVNYYAQPTIQWQKSLGGTNDELPNCIIQTNDGGYIVAGDAGSQDGDVFGNHLGGDAWLVKLNSTGVIQWKKCYGGTSADHVYSIIQTSDGGYIFAGSTSSNDGDISGNHGFDAWVVKLNDTGAIQWSKCYGGTSGSSEAHSIKQTSDGAYIFAGYTRANNGDVSGNHDTTGQYTDGWIVRLNNQGTILWQKCYGGSSLDGFYTMISTLDGGYTMAGFSLSNDGDGCDIHDSSEGDYWVIKIDSIGQIQWTKCFGGNGFENAYSINQTLDSGYIVGGTTTSINSGDVNGNHGGYDLWLIKLSGLGSLQWAKCYGGTDDEEGGWLTISNNSGFVITGTAYSIDGDVGAHVGKSSWIFKIDLSGNIVWQKCYGSVNGQENPTLVIHCNDGGYAGIAASSGSVGDVTGHHGAVGTSDYWVVKLAPDTTSGINEVKASLSLIARVYPNPSNGNFKLDYQLLSSNGIIRILDFTGRILYERNISSTNKSISINLSSFDNGIYFWKVIDEHGNNKTGRITILKLN